jgi:hypothetical protein
VFSGLVTGKWQHPMVYATLVPVMGGVAYASASEVSFNMTQFISAMVSNICFSLRGVLGKVRPAAPASSREGMRSSASGTSPAPLPRRKPGVCADARTRVFAGRDVRQGV